MSRFASKKYTHIILCTKSNALIHSSHLSRLFDYMREILGEEKGVAVTGLNGMCDHVHILCILSEDIILSELVPKVKELTTQWLKDIDPSYHDFKWKKGYAGFVIRPPVMITVQHVINQEYIHEKLSFQEELKMFFRDHRDSSVTKVKFWWDD